MSCYKYFCVCADNRCIPDLMLLSGYQNVYVYISSCHFISTSVSVLTIGVYQTLCCCLDTRMFISTFCCHFISTFVSVLTIGVYQTLCCCLDTRMFMSTFGHVIL